MTNTQKSARATRGKASQAFTQEERAAMQERSREQRAAARRGKTTEADGERDLLAKIAEMQEPDRAIAERLHAIVKASVPTLSPRTWYGMPAYAKEGTVLLFFQPGHKFKTRYATLGFSDKAALDEGDMWPTSYALTKLTGEVESKIRALVQRAAG